MHIKHLQFHLLIGTSPAWCQRQALMPPRFLIGELSMNYHFNSIKAACAIAVLGLASVASVQAAPITVGGITWDPDAATDYTSQSVNMRQFINSTTGELTGFGIVTVINGLGSASFCASGCELTFQFGGFTPVGSQVVPGIGSNIQYTGGFVKFFVDSVPDVANPFDYNSLTWANTGDGNLWLDLVGNGVNTGGVTFTGQAFGLVGGTFSLLSGGGKTDVTGLGLADSYFDYNTLADGSDVTFSTSLTFFHNGQLDPTDVSGTGNVFSDTRVEVPEPGSLALVGLAMLGLFGARRLRS
jgi:hypothetical protein